MLKFLPVLSLSFVATINLGQAQTIVATKPNSSYDSDNGCAKVAERATRDHLPQLRFVAFPQNADPARDHWRLAHSGEEQQQAANNGNSAALAFLQGKRVVLVQFTFQSEFGDWVNYIGYCYRPDGTLSHLHAVLNSFQGDMTVVRDSSFNQFGKPIAHTQENYELGTRTPKELTPEFWDQPPPLFLRVSQLPFAKDLPKPSTSNLAPEP